MQKAIYFLAMCSFFTINGFGQMPINGCWENLDTKVQHSETIGYSQKGEWLLFRVQKGGSILDGEHTPYEERLLAARINEKIETKGISLRSVVIVEMGASLRTLERLLCALAETEIKETYLWFVEDP